MTQEGCSEYRDSKFLEEAGMLVKHSIVMICYNQKEYIRTALDSVLCEKVKPYEIVIADDCSTDGTRIILEEYRTKYPEIIKLVLNEKNLGLFANFNNVAPKATGDVISILSGDDWYKPGLLENMNNKINELNLDPINTSFLLLPNLVIHQLDGSEHVQCNDENVLANYTAVGAALRGLLISRQLGMSRALYNRWPLFERDSNEIGLWADYVQGVLLMQYVDKMVVMNCESHVYRVGVGVTSKTNIAALDRSYHAALVRLQSYYASGTLKLSEIDAKYLEFKVQCCSVKVKPSTIGVIHALQAGWAVIRIRWSELSLVAKELYRMVRQVIGGR